VSVSIRAGERADVPVIAELIRGLARYERLEDQVSMTEARLEATLFESRQYAETLIAEADGKAVGFARPALQLGVAHFQSVQFRAQSLILLPRVAQTDVVAPAMLEVINNPGPRALHRRNQFHGPDTDQPHLPLALDLHGEQQDLCNDDGRQQRQGFVS